MELLYNYQIAPGCCHICRSSKPGPIIDTRREDPDKVLRQNVYICGECLTAAFQLINSPKVLVEKELIVEKDGEIVALTNEVARLMSEAEQHEIWIAKAVASQREVDA